MTQDQLESIIHRALTNKFRVEVARDLREQIAVLLAWELIEEFKLDDGAEVAAPESKLEEVTEDKRRILIRVEDGIDKIIKALEDLKNEID